MTACISKAAGAALGGAEKQRTASPAGPYGHHRRQLCWRRRLVISLRRSRRIGPGLLPCPHLFRSLMKRFDALRQCCPLSIIKNLSLQLQFEFESQLL